MRTSPRPSLRSAQVARLGAVLVGLVAVLALVVPTAAPAATSREAGKGQALGGERGGRALRRPRVAWRRRRQQPVVVTADDSVTAGEVAAIQRGQGTSAGVLRFERATGVFRPLLGAGDAICGNRYRCSLGFNVVRGGALLPHRRTLREAREDLVDQREPQHPGRSDRRLQSTATTTRWCATTTPR